MIDRAERGYGRRAMVIVLAAVVFATSIFASYYLGTVATVTRTSTVTTTPTDTQTTMQTSTSTTTTTTTATATKLTTSTSTSTSTFVYTSTTYVTSTTIASSATTPANQTFFHAGSNHNYFFMDNGMPIQNATVSMILAGPLVGTTLPASLGGNWSFQVNAYAPPGYLSAYMQFVASYVPTGVATGLVVFNVEYFAQNDLKLLSLATSGPINSGMVAGTHISLGIMTNSTGNIVGASIKVTEFNGTVPYNSHFSLKPYPSLASPMVGFEPSLIGYCCAARATFTQANGIFLAQAQSPITWTANFPGAYPWVQYKDIGTVETSNIRYWLPQQDSTTIVQAFSQ
jgi:hypothetical protein